MVLVMMTNSSIGGIYIPAIHGFANPKAKDYRKYESNLICPAHMNDTKKNMSMRKIKGGE